MTDIDQEVARFATDLEALSAIDVGVQEAEIADLAAAIINAVEDREATSAILRFSASHGDAPLGYVRSVVLSAVSRFAMYVAVATPTWKVPKLASRLSTIALACRIIDLGEVA